MALDRGELVLRRQFMRDDLLSRVWTGRVVAEDQHGLWVWVATGSVYYDIGAADGRAFRDVPFGDWLATPKVLRELTWRGDMLMLHPAAGAYSVWLRFDAEGSFRDWYVNLEEPVTRWDDGTARGLDTTDQDLDVIVAPDRSWRWKDEDEFAAHLAHPDTYWVEDAASVWAEGKRVIAMAEAGESPFDGVRTDFRPDPTWTAPATVPPGFDRPRQRR